MSFNGTYPQPHAVCDLRALASDSELITSRSSKNQHEIQSSTGKRPEDSILKALIVGNSDAVHDLVAQSLERDGFDVELVADGKSAIQSIRVRTPAFVLTDIHLPQMTSLELVQEIRCRHPQIPVLLITGTGADHQAMDALEAGAAGFVPKQWLDSEFESVLNQILAASSPHRSTRQLMASLETYNARYRLASDPQLITPMVECLQDALLGVRLGDENLCMRVGIALQEALSNAVYHGNLEVDSDLRQHNETEFYELARNRQGIEPYCYRQVLIHACVTPKLARFTITDEGPGFNTSILDKPIEPEDLLQTGGRGLLLIRTFMDQVKFNKAGNQITLIKRADLSS